jgi:hypothetical protein
MRVFVWTLLVLFILDAWCNFARLCKNDYPKVTHKEAWQDALGLVLSICFLVWTVLLLI